MRSRNPVHYIGARHGDSQRHARGNALGHADDVGMHARVLDRKPFSGAADAALDFVDYQENSVAVADPA